LFHETSQNAVNRESGGALAGENSYCLARIVSLE